MGGASIDVGRVFLSSPYQSSHRIVLESDWQESSSAYGCPMHWFYFVLQQTIGALHTRKRYHVINKLLSLFRTFLPKSLASHQKLCTEHNPMTKPSKSKSYSGKVMFWLSKKILELMSINTNFLKRPLPAPPS